MAFIQIKLSPNSHSNQCKPSHFNPYQILCNVTLSTYRFLLFHAHPFWIQLSYFSTVSVIGFFALKILPIKDVTSAPSNLDLFFMSVSAVTVSSMGSIEMESFSNSQLVILSLLMLLGGEVFTSMLSLQFTKITSKKHPETISDKSKTLELITNQLETGSIDHNPNLFAPQMSSDQVKHNCISYLGLIVAGYLILVHLTGYTAILAYLNSYQSVRDILEAKGINLTTFSFFTVVSSFANCGFLPNNENMIVFRVYSGLLIIVSAQILLGNTLFASILRLLIRGLKKVTKRQEFDYMLKNHEEIEYDHLLPSSHAKSVAFCVAGFLLVQFVLFLSLEWRSEGLEGLGIYRKLVAVFFMSVNSRHAGESVVDLSAVSPAILVLYIVMMYLPSYTCFMPTEKWHIGTITNGTTFLEGKKRSNICQWQNFVLSQLSYLAIFLIIICITERRQLLEDPLNFNVLNIIFEMISAYGNVGFSTGYSCKRRLKLDDDQCQDKCISFSGKWTNEGKLILIAVMFFGRLKKFSFHGGESWKLN